MNLCSFGRSNQVSVTFYDFCVLKVSWVHFLDLLDCVFHSVFFCFGSHLQPLLAPAKIRVIPPT